MEWMQVFTIIATLLGGIFYIHSDVREIRKDIQQQNARMDRMNEMFSQRSDNLYETFSKQASDQSQRSDKLYEMFIDLLKSKNTP